MFTLEQIDAAHSAVKSGADFPAYVQALARLGVAHYDVFVVDGHAEYMGTDGTMLCAEPNYPALEVPLVSDAEHFQEGLKRHQAGETDYPTFCRDAAAAGVEKWRVDISALTCT